MARGLSVQRAVLVAWLAVAVGAPACAQSGTCESRRDPGVGALDELTWRQLNAISEEVGQERYDEAREDLQGLLGRAGRDGYLQAILNQALGRVEWAGGDYRAALEYFETALELDRLPNPVHFELIYQVAQLYFTEERYDDALDRLRLWFCAVPPEQVTAAAWVLKASIHARQENFSAALEAIDTAIALDANSPESWYRMKLAAHYELQQYPPAAATLEALTARWPDRKQYWIQLSQVLYRLKQDARALAVLALAHRQGMLDTQADLLYLASLYRSKDIPYKAAEVLEQGIRDGIVEADSGNWALVADAWYAAEELQRSLAAYDEAGKAASDGQADLRRGYILVDLERWPEVLEALNRALGKGGLDDRQTGEAYLLRGIAQFNLGELARAGTDWDFAGHHERSRGAAREWLNHLRETQERQAMQAEG